MPTMKADSVWRRVIEASWPDVSAAEVSRLLDLRFSKGDLAKMRRLGDQAQEGTLSETDRAELEEMVAIGRTIALLKSLARLHVAATANGDLAPATPARRRRPVA